MIVTKETLRRARRYARTKFNELRQDHKYDGHPSHAAARALELTEAAFDLGTCGVEGVCDQEDVRGGGVSYLNAGDPYAMTVAALTYPSSCTFLVTCLEEIADHYPHWR